MESTAAKILVARCVCPKDVVSYNVSQGQHWSHKTKSAQQKKNWVVWFRSAEGLDFPKPQGKNRRLVKITRLISGRMRFFEKVNVYAAMKPVEDALVTLGWLIDDAEKYEELEVEQVRVGGAPEWMQAKPDGKIAVEIYDLDETIRE